MRPSFIKMILSRPDVYGYWQLSPKIYDLLLEIEVLQISSPTELLKP